MQLETIHNAWISWREKSVNRRIFSAFVTVSVLTVIVKLLTAVKEILLAYHYGISPQLDTYLMAWMFVTLLMYIVTESFNVAFVPTYVDVRNNQGEEAAQQLFSSVLWYTTFILLFGYLLMSVAFPYVLPFIASLYPASKIYLTKKLFYIMLPVMVINGFRTLFGGVLNSRERFAVAAITPCIMYLSVITVLVLPEYSSNITSVAWATLAGFTIETLVLAWWLMRNGIIVLPKRYPLTDKLKGVIKQYFPLLTASILILNIYFVDQIMAAHLGPGNLAALNYGIKLVSLIFTLSAGLWNAALPYSSEMVSRQDWDGLHYTVRKFTRLILLASVPLSIILIIYTPVIIKLFYQHGAFTVKDTLIVSKIQMIALVQLPFYLINVFLMRIVSALNKNKLLLYSASLSFVINIILNLILMQWYGIYGIAASTTIVTIVTFGFFALVVMKLLGDQRSQARAQI